MYRRLQQRWREQETLARNEVLRIQVVSSLRILSLRLGRLRRFPQSTLTLHVCTVIKFDPIATTCNMPMEYQHLQVAHSPRQ